MKDTLICGDALEVLKTLPDNCIDMGITSPPYNKQENKKSSVFTFLTLQILLVYFLLYLRGFR